VTGIGNFVSDITAEQAGALTRTATKRFSQQ